jgi:Ala-tRNA(Pro) deacylase
MSNETLRLITDFLKGKNIQFEHLSHEHVHTSEDAAKIRGNSIHQAAKAIVLRVRNKKDDDLPNSKGLGMQDSSSKYRFIQIVLPGNRKIEFKALKRLLELKSAELATPDDVLKKTGCSVGSVPPFGKLLGIETFVDSSLLENEIIFFSAGTHNDSIRMRNKDYIDAINPDIISASSSSQK